MRSVIKVLQVVPEMGYGGAEKVVLNYFEHMDREKYRFDFVTHGGVEDYHKGITDSGSKIFYLKTLGALGYGKYKNLVKEKINVRDYDIVHIHIGHITGLYASIYKKLGAKKIISHAHITKCPNPSHQRYMPIFRALSVHFADKLIACGKDAGKFCFGNAKYRVLNNGIDINLYKRVTERETDDLRKSLGIDKDEFVVGHVGRFTKEKNHEFIVRLAAEYKRKYDNIKFVLVGEGVLKSEIEKLAEEMKCKDSIVFTGVRSDIPVFMRMFDVFILPSLNEGLPLVGIEAQAAGLPCIFSNTIDYSVCVIREKCTVLPIDKGAALWVDELEKIRTCGPIDIDIYAEMSAKGYGISSIAEQLSNIYDDLVGASNA